MPSVRTNLTKSDITGAVFARLTRLGALLKAWFIWTVGLAVLLAFVRGLPTDAVDVLVLSISACAGALLSVAVSMAFMLLRVRRAVKDGDGVLGEHDYVLTESGLHEKTLVNETLATWSGIERVDRTRTFAFIVMRNGAFHIIPRRSFTSLEHEAGFLSEIERRASSGA